MEYKLNWKNKIKIENNGNIKVKGTNSSIFSGIYW